MYDAELEAAHKHCGSHRAEITRSDRCGCFYCLTVFTPEEVTDWVDWSSNAEGVTALCPRCGIDSVLGSGSGYPINREFLRRMQTYWFS